jgi:uncharacterized protein (TIRG00374 family)
MRLSILLSLIFSISIIIILLYFTFNEQTIHYLTTQPLRYEFFIAAIAVNILYWILWGARLRVLSNAGEGNAHVGLWESTKIVIANLFLANITPSMAGGEPVRIYLLMKNGLTAGHATASVLGERLLDLIFLLVCFPFAFLVFQRFLRTGFLFVAIAVAVLLFALAIALFAYMLKKPEKIKAFVMWLSNKLQRFSRKQTSEHSRFEKISVEVDNFHQSMTYFLSKGKKPFLKAGILTAAFWITGWMIPVLVLMGLDLSPHIIESSAAQILLIIIVMIPTTPGSAGITEGGAAALYNMFIPSSLVGVFVLLFRLFTYDFGLIAGAIFQYRIFKSVASFSLESIKKEQKST